MAAPTPTPARARSIRRRTWIAIGAGAAAVVVAVALAVALLASARSAAVPAPVASPALVPTATPSPTPSAGAAGTAEADRQHKLYRAYVSAVLRGGVAAIASMGGLAGCRSGHDECVDRLDRATTQVGALQDTLAATPAPNCLVGPDEVLRDGLSLQHDGLDAAHSAVEARDRVRLAQGAILTAVGLWRTGQAVVEARGSDC
ncbi:MAG TPA: hypothetical protein VOB72_05710 [Candidatus Dormibacteraeota bacterium]|nr:hypothetical protein [Candidatus Dormibacteraeota bacterium]